MTEYQTHAALVATLETEIVRLRAVNAELRSSIQKPPQVAHQYDLAHRLRVHLANRHTLTGPEFKDGVGKLLAEYYYAAEPHAPIQQPDTKLVQAARQALEALEKCSSALAEELAAWDIDPPLHHVLEASNACAPAITALREALEAVPADSNHEAFKLGYAKGVDDAERRAKARGEQPVAVEQEPVQTRERFESWVKAYSTLPLAKDSHGYADLTVEILWHAWQAAKTNAPEGASEGESDANTRLGLAGHDSNCKHEFSVQPSSGIRLCAHCSLSEVATRKHTAPQPTRQPLTDEQISDIARYKCYLDFEDDGEAIEIFARAIEKAHGIGGES